MRSWDDSSYVESEKKYRVHPIFLSFFIFIEIIGYFWSNFAFQAYVKNVLRTWRWNIWASMVAVVMAVTVTAAAAGLAVALL